MSKKRCKYCGDPILHVNPYCSKCQKVMLENFGHYTMGLTREEIETYLGRRANTLSTKALMNKFSKIAGVNTQGVHICEKCGHNTTLMYRHDVQRFADVMFHGTPTYWD